MSFMGNDLFFRTISFDVFIGTWVLGLYKFVFLAHEYSPVANLSAD